MSQPSNIFERDDREAKLPAWARERIEALRRLALEARGEAFNLRTSTTSGPFWLEPTSESGPRFYLPSQAGRLFYGNPAALQYTSDPTALEFTASRAGGLKEPWVTIRSIQGAIVAQPEASNSLLVRAGAVARR